MSIIIHYLEMTTSEQFRDSPVNSQLLIMECEVRQYRVNHFMYQFVGEPWLWTDKLQWTADQWQQYVERDNFRTWIAYFKGSIVGYYELEQDENGKTQIAYFGLVPEFIGRGFGRELLSHSIRSAWDWPGTRYLWVHTCNLDHPHALDNYLARGFRKFKEEIKTDSE